MKCRAGFLVMTFILAVGCIKGQTDSFYRRIEISPNVREEKDLFDLFRKKKRLVSDSMKSSKPKLLVTSSVILKIPIIVSYLL